MTIPVEPFGPAVAREALDALGRLCPPNSEIVLIGGAAAMLCHGLLRTTHDIDVVSADPRLSDFAHAISRVADELSLPKNWLNDGAKNYAEVLPVNYRGRLVVIGHFGHLSVSAVSRQDFLLLKFYALRPEDIDDINALRPTADDLAFVRAELPRIAQINPRQAHRMELFLDEQWS